MKRKRDLRKMNEQRRRNRACYCTVGLFVQFTCLAWTGCIANNFIYLTGNTRSTWYCTGTTNSCCGTLDGPFSLGFRIFLFSFIFILSQITCVFSVKANNFFHVTENSLMAFISEINIILKLLRVNTSLNNAVKKISLNNTVKFLKVEIL